MEIPEITDVDIVFPVALPNLRDFTEEARQRGFRRDWMNHPACERILNGDTA